MIWAVTISVCWALLMTVALVFILKRKGVRVRKTIDIQIGETGEG